ncbi:MAG TPA: 30S ribosomal protein S18 [Candidatus Pacearchaeota archaeon]|nr:30S ribosomal protein S18 [Candidatus Pacearchaeota archaeon]
MKKTACHLCQKEIKHIDHTDVSFLSGFLTSQNEIKKQGKTGLCAQHQRKVARAIKRARTLGLLPYIAGHNQD